MLLFGTELLVKYSVPSNFSNLAHASVRVSHCATQCKNKSPHNFYGLLFCTICVHSTWILKTGKRLENVGN